MRAIVQLSMIKGFQIVTDWNRLQSQENQASCTIMTSVTEFFVTIFKTSIFVAILTLPPLSLKMVSDSTADKTVENTWNEDNV